MPSLQTHNNSGRKKLVITKAPEAKQIAGKDGKPLDFLEFMAKIEGEDSTVKYSVWSKALYEFIKLDTIIDCDVVVKEREQKDSEGNPYHNRKITQIYVDGQPVGKQQQRQWGKSPEIVAMEIDSKFRDTALMQACGFVNGLKYLQAALVPDKVSDILLIANEFYAWLKGSPEKPVGKPRDKKSVQPEDKKATASPTESQGARPEGMPAVKTGAQLASYVGKRGIDSVQFTAITQVANPNDLKTEAQLIAAWNVLAPEMKGTK